MRRDVDAGEVAPGCAGHLPPFARRRAPVEEVQFRLGGPVETALLDVQQRVGVQGDRVDAAERVEEHPVVRLGAELQPPGPLGQPALRCPAVEEAFDQEVVPGRPCGGEARLGGGATGRVGAPVGGRVQFQFDLPGRGAQEFGSRFLLALGHVEPVDVEGFGVVGTAPPGAAGDDHAVAQGDPLPFGAVPGEPVGLTGVQRVGHGVEEMGVARVERADDRIGHGFLRDASCVVRSRSDEIHAGTTGRERGVSVNCTALPPSVGLGRGAHTVDHDRRAGPSLFRCGLNQP